MKMSWTDPPCPGHLVGAVPLAIRPAAPLQFPEPDREILARHRNHRVADHVLDRRGPLGRNAAEGDADRLEMVALAVGARRSARGGEPAHAAQGARGVATDSNRP